MPSRVLITGGAGLLGGALVRAAPAGCDLHVTVRSAPAAGAPAHRVELSDAAATRALWEELRPELVIHTAYSMSDVERDVVAATRSLVAATASVGAGLNHLSSDMVFDGERAPYAESDAPAPITDYGRAKLRAESVVTDALPLATIVRTSLLVSLRPLDRGSAWVAAGARGDTAARLFVDEIRSPIAVDDLAAQLWELAALPAGARGGVWHLAGPEAVSRYTLGLLVAAALDLPGSRLERGWLSDSPARRPRDLRLLTARADAALRRRARPIAALMDSNGSGDRR